MEQTRTEGTQAMTRYYVALAVAAAVVTLFHLFPVQMLCLGLPLVFFATFQRYPYHSHYWW